MTTLQDLEKYLDHKFIRASYPQDDFKTFKRKYVEYLRSVCRDNGWKYLKTKQAHYGFYCYIQNDKRKTVELIIDDVRFGRDWYYRVFVRRIAPYRIGSRRECPLEDLCIMLRELFSYE